MLPLASVTVSLEGINPQDKLVEIQSGDEEDDNSKDQSHALPLPVPTLSALRIYFFMFFLLIFVQHEMGLTEFSSSLSPLSCYFTRLSSSVNKYAAPQFGRHCRARKTIQNCFNTDDPEHISSAALD